MDTKTIRRTVRGLLREAQELELEAEKRRIAAQHLEGVLPANERVTSGSPRRIASNGTNGHQPHSASEVLLKVIEEGQRPMSLDDIREAVQRKGWDVPKSLHETMRRLKERKKIERVGFSTYQIAKDSGAESLSSSG